MRISKQRLRQILREELEIALLKEQFFDPNSSPGGTLFDQWRNVFSNASSAFTNAYNQSYNQATGATNPATNTGTTATSPPAEAPNQEATPIIIRYYFKPETTREEIARVNITNMLQPVARRWLDQIDVSIIVNNLRARYANSGYPANYDWTQYANQLKESFGNSIRVSAPNIQENNDQTIASYTVSAPNIPAFNTPNNSIRRGTDIARIFDPITEQFNRAMPNKLLPPEQTPERRNPDLTGF